MNKHTISNNYIREILKDGDWGNDIFYYESKMHKPQAGQKRNTVV